MAFCERLEIYIPVEAEVKSIILSSLPNSILKRMCDADSSIKLPDSLKGIWICPAVIRRKGQKVASHTGNDAKKEFVSLMGCGSQNRSNSRRLSFVSSNAIAYKVLKATKHESAVSEASDLESQDSSPQTQHDALVIYNRQIYLSIKSLNRNRSKRKMCDPQEASPSAQPLDSSSRDLSSKSPKKVPSDNKAGKKQIACKVPHIQNPTSITENIGESDSSLTSRAITQSTDGVHRVTGKDAKDEHTVDEVQEPDHFEPKEEEEEEVMPKNVDREIQDLVNDEPAGLNNISNTNFITPISTSEEDQGSIQSWATIEPISSSESQNESEFNELEQDEMIARMKARLKEKEAALKSLAS